ncbi:DNA-directed DNA polymerase [Malassezia vespertilionis]|uniref:DNA polymerase kappa n=1 Tax=Malassezia vespertilionis TaxID=2020962 RepID=A0A2N1JAK6_9BASI|nr:DNA-directed DNA polymerase [Malassezia vespertilionis]PKI83577.1 hypothetical protein MVES_002441 [Malassezia vespertilionis]WFD07226.1 DNA-directed DNA polymerase [Malassezia vespertilionis]
MASSNVGDVCDKDDGEWGEEEIASFQKRMAGPSSHKACVESNEARFARIIHQVSKGSKFYENQRKRHEHVTAKVAKIRERLAEVQAALRSGILRESVEHDVQRTVARLESQRDLSHCILHCDMDMFYAAVELQRSPSLQGRCFAVGKGVILTASYEARKRGVRSGMAEFVARALCEDLLVVPANFDAYKQSSDAIMDVLRSYDPTLYPRSLDEAYLDITTYCSEHEISVEEAVEQLRADVRTKTGLTISVGAAPNMLLAKIASDRNKPDGHFRLMPDRTSIMDFLAQLPVRKVPGIGHVTERLLEAIGVETCGDLWARRVVLSMCMDSFSLLLSIAMGISSSHVAPPGRAQRKSVGSESTFTPTSDATLLDMQLHLACTRLAQELCDKSLRARSVSLVGKHDTYERFSRARGVTRRDGVASYEELYEIGHALLAQEMSASGNTLSLRLLGIRASSLVDVRTHTGHSLDTWLQRGPPPPPPPLPPPPKAVHQCPVCEKPIAIPSGLAALEENAHVNQHIDACLHAPKPKRQRTTLDVYFGVRT